MRIVNKLLEIEKIKRYKNTIESKLLPELRDSIGLNIRIDSKKEDNYHIKYSAALNDYFYIIVEFLTSSKIDKEFPVSAYMSFDGLRNYVGTLDLNDIEGCINQFDATLEDLGVYDKLKEEKSKENKIESLDDVKGNPEWCKYKLDDEEFIGYYADGYIFDSKGNIVGKPGQKYKGKLIRYGRVSTGGN